MTSREQILQDALALGRKIGPSWWISWSRAWTRAGLLRRKLRPPGPRKSDSGSRPTIVGKFKLKMLT